MPTIAKYKHRKTGIRLGLVLPKINGLIVVGRCKTCGGPVEVRHASRVYSGRFEKQFCRLQCFLKSQKYARMVREKNIKVTSKVLSKLPSAYSNLVSSPCLYCGKNLTYLKSKPRKFCSPRNGTCQRKYYAERFDRWIASPQAISLPQNFDEFLTQDKLPCLVDGCKFIGHNLSVHMNKFHGVDVKAFKGAAGFNSDTSVVSGRLREAFDRRRVSTTSAFNPSNHLLATILMNLETKKEGLKKKGVSKNKIKSILLSRRKVAIKEIGAENINLVTVGKIIKNRKAFEKNRKLSLGCKLRLEGKEHFDKARAIRIRHKKKCKGCKKLFFGWSHSVFHSNECKAKYRNKRFGTRVVPMICFNCRRDFLGSRYQYKYRLSKGLRVFCSGGCVAADNLKSVLSAKKRKCRVRVGHT